MRKIWIWILARFRLSKSAVCEASAARGPYDDFHDYPDSTQPWPMHFHLYRCARCGKEFFI